MPSHPAQQDLFEVAELGDDTAKPEQRSVSSEEWSCAVQV